MIDQLEKFNWKAEQIYLNDFGNDKIRYANYIGGRAAKFLTLIQNHTDFIAKKKSNM